MEETLCETSVPNGSGFLRRADEAPYVFYGLSPSFAHVFRAGTSSLPSRVFSTEVHELIHKDAII